MSTFILNRSANSLDKSKLDISNKYSTCLFRCQENSSSFLKSIDDESFFGSTVKGACYLHSIMFVVKLYLAGVCRFPGANDPCRFGLLKNGRLSTGTAARCQAKSYPFAIILWYRFLPLLRIIWPSSRRAAVIGKSNSVMRSPLT